MNFYEVYPLVSGDEGGYANKPDDNGGETYAGIARNYRHNADWPGWTELDAIKKRNGPLPNNFRSPILDDMARDWFKKKYWDEVQMDSFPAHLRYCIFDVIVNFGFDVDTLASRAWAFIRAANGVDIYLPSGKLDPVTTVFEASLFWTAEKITPEAYTIARKENYKKIVQSSPAQMGFLHGWLTRADNVLDLTNIWLLNNTA